GSGGRSRWRPRSRFVLRQVLLDRPGGDLVGQSADLELVLAEEVGIVRGGEVGGEFADLAVDGFVNGSGQILDLGLLLGRQGCRCHGGLPCRGGFSSELTAIALVYKNSTNFQDAHRRTCRGEFLGAGCAAPRPFAVRSLVSNRHQE